MKRDPAEASLTTRLQIPGTMAAESGSGSAQCGRSATISQSDSARSPPPCNPLFIGNSSFLLPLAAAAADAAAALMLLSHLSVLPAVSSATRPH